MQWYELSFQFDPQGNAAHLLDDDGLVLAHLAYDAWGQRMSGNNPTPYGYKGQWGYYTDGETGLLLLTHRYFDPATGRFLTRDPIGFEGGVNGAAINGKTGLVEEPEANMNLCIETEQEADGRWIAEVPDMPGALVYAPTREEAIARVKALALVGFGTRLPVVE